MESDPPRFTEECWPSVEEGVWIGGLVWKWLNKCGWQSPFRPSHIFRHGKSRWVSVSAVAKRFDISSGSVCSVMYNILRHCRVGAKWVAKFFASYWSFCTFLFLIPQKFYLSAFIAMSLVWGVWNSDTGLVNVFIFSVFCEMDVLQSDQMVNVFVLCTYTAFCIPMAGILGFSLSFLPCNFLIS